jgi:hypothetical protein
MLKLAGGGEAVEKWCRWLNIVQILCTHVGKWNMPVETIPGMGIKENGGGCEFKYDVFNIW